MALYFADLPQSPPSGDRIAELADEGARRIGGADEVRHLHRQWRALAERHELGLLSDQEYLDELHRLFPDEERMDTCVALDFERLSR